MNVHWELQTAITTRHALIQSIRTPVLVKQDLQEMAWCAAVSDYFLLLLLISVQYGQATFDPVQEILV